MSLSLHPPYAPVGLFVLSLRTLAQLASPNLTPPHSCLGSPSLTALVRPRLTSPPLPTPEPREETEPHGGAPVVASFRLVSSLGSVRSFPGFLLSSVPSSRPVATRGRSVPATRSTSLSLAVRSETDRVALVPSGSLLPAGRSEREVLRNGRLSRSISSGVSCPSSVSRPS